MSKKKQTVEPGLRGPSLTVAQIKALWEIRKFARDSGESSDLTFNKALAVILGHPLPPPKYESSQKTADELSRDYACYSNRDGGSNPKKFPLRSKEEYTLVNQKAKSKN